MSDHVSNSAWVPRERALAALIQADTGLRDELADALSSRVDELVAMLYAAAARGRA